MNDTTATEALVAEEAPENAAATEDEAYGAAFDKIAADGITEDDDPETPEDKAEPEGDIDPEGEDAEGEPEKPKAKAPTDLPGGIKAAWDSFSKEVQESIVASQRDMAQKLSDQGRMVQGLSPIRDVLVTAAKEMPHLANMRPEQVASEIFSLAKISQEFQSKPVETLLGLAKKHGMEQALREALTDGTVSQASSTNVALQNEVMDLRQQLARVSSPDYFRERFSSVSREYETNNEVKNFADTAEHWAEVESILPNYIPLVQAEMGDGASAKDVLSAAYELAVQRKLPGAKAKLQAADEAVIAIDPKRTEAAIKAKSVNVQGTINGKGRALTEDQALAAAYDRIARN